MGTFVVLNLMLRFIWDAAEFWQNHALKHPDLNFEI